jgi:hypothetical protein
MRIMIITSSPLATRALDWLTGQKVLGVEQQTGESGTREVSTSTSSLGLLSVASVYSKINWRSILKGFDDSVQCCEVVRFWTFSIV